MIHIVFNEADKPVLNAAMEMDESFAAEIFQVKDDYAVGPLVNIFTAEGMDARKQWWQEVLTGGDFEIKPGAEEVDDTALVAQLKERLASNEEEFIWIWAAANKHDVSGYYWFMSQFKEYAGRIFILYLNNLPFFNEKGNIFYPEWLHTIPAKEFLKAKKLAREITLSEFEVEPDEWTRICNENKAVRLLEGGKKLIQQEVDFYDVELKKFITKDWQKASKIINQFLNKAKDTTGDAFLLWRLKAILSFGQYDRQGELKNMKDFEVKSKSAEPEMVVE